MTTTAEKKPVIYYILEATKPFDGSVFNTMEVNAGDPIEAGRVHLAGGLWPDYNGKHGNNLKAVTEKELEQLLDKYLADLQGDFKEVTKEQYLDALECLPPKRWTNYGKNNDFFFLGECYTYNLYSLYANHNGKYYTALRAINLTTDQIINQLNNIK